MDVLELKGVTKRFGERTVLHDLTLFVPEGSIYGFIGENGAGKSSFCWYSLYQPFREFFVG